MLKTKSLGKPRKYLHLNVVAFKKDSECGSRSFPGRKIAIVLGIANENTSWRSTLSGDGIMDEDGIMELLTLNVLETTLRQKAVTG